MAKRYPAYGETCRKWENPNPFAVTCHAGNKCAGASSNKNFRSKTMHAVDTSQYVASFLKMGGVNDEF